MAQLIVALLAASGAGADIRYEVYRHMLHAFEDDDCDTLDECLGRDPAYDDAYSDHEDDKADEGDADDEEEEDK